MGAKENDLKFGDLNVGDLLIYSVVDYPKYAMFYLVTEQLADRTMLLVYFADSSDHGYMSRRNNTTLSHLNIQRISCATTQKKPI